MRVAPSSRVRGEGRDAWISTTSRDPRRTVVAWRVTVRSRGAENDIRLVRVCAMSEMLDIALRMRSTFTKPARLEAV